MESFFFSRNKQAFSQKNLKPKKKSPTDCLPPRRTDLAFFQEKKVRTFPLKIWVPVWGIVENYSNQTCDPIPKSGTATECNGEIGSQNLRNYGLDLFRERAPRAVFFPLELGEGVAPVTVTRTYFKFVNGHGDSLSPRNTRTSLAYSLEVRMWYCSASESRRLDAFRPLGTPVRLR